MRADAVRAESVGMVHQAPFRPFVPSMEYGDRVTVGHPQNIAFDPGGGAAGLLRDLGPRSDLRHLHSLSVEHLA